jgi:hypothetical protein
MKKSPEERRAAAKAARLWKLFRLRPEEWDKILRFQSQHPVYRLLLGNRLSTDHRHASGLVSGILEWRLNRAYGLIEKAFPKNTADVLRALAEYHDKPPAEQALGKKTWGLLGIAKVKKKMKYGGTSA